MIPIPVPYRTNPSPYSIGGGSYTINAYVEEGGDDNKANYLLMPCAGMTAFGNELSGPCRGMIYLEDESVIYTVNGLQLYKVDESATATVIGIIGGSGPVRMVRNDSDPQITCILSGSTVYYVKEDVISVKSYAFEKTDETFETITPIDVTYCAGRFLFALENGRFYWTEINSTEMSGLNFATAEGNPDGLVAIHAEVDILFLIGVETTEVWGVTTDSQSPFMRAVSSYQKIGTRSRHTVKSFNNAMAMVGSDNVVYQVSPGGYEPFSSNEVSRLIEADPNKSDLVAFTHERGGNKFYTLHGTGWTREYNAKTGTWAVRNHPDNEGWHCVHSVSAWGKKIFGDKATGKLFEADYTTFLDDGEYLEWGFDTNLVHNSPNGLAFNTVAIDMQTGSVPNYGYDGKVMLSWSDDLGASWKGNRILSLGNRGQYQKRVRTHRLGRTGEKGRIFRVRITDASVRAIAGMYGDIGGLQI